MKSRFSLTVANWPWLFQAVSTSERRRMVDFTGVRGTRCWVPLKFVSTGMKGKLWARTGAENTVRAAANARAPRRGRRGKTWDMTKSFPPEGEPGPRAGVSGTNCPRKTGLFAKYRGCPAACRDKLPLGKKFPEGFRLPRATGIR